MHQVYRAPMRSRHDDVDPGLAVERALESGVCGVGGRLSTPPSTLAEALGRTDDEYDERTARRLERFAAAPTGSFVWTRDTDGLYFLGRLTGEWRYDAAPDALAADLVHVRACDWLARPVPPERVPAATLATFARGGRNFQQTHDATVGADSAALWEGAPPA